MNWVSGWMWTGFVVEGDEEIGVGDEEKKQRQKDEQNLRFFYFIPLQFCVFGFGPSFLATHHLSWHISLLLPTHPLPYVSPSATTTFL